MGQLFNVSIAAMNHFVGWRQYLVTHFQVDEFKFFTWESLGKRLETVFNVHSTVAKVDYWAYSREDHQNDSFHYYCAVNITGWIQLLLVKTRIAGTWKNMVFKSILVK